MSESIEVSRMVPTTAEAIYKAWLSGPEHSRMTGSAATYNDADDTFTAWEGYISGKTIEKEPYTRIVQNWRTTEFGDTDPDSTLEVLFEPQGEGTMVTVRQSNIPDGQGEAYRSGWQDHYFEPMISYSHSARAKIDQAGHAISEAAEAASEAIEATGEQVQKTATRAARSVKKTAKKAASVVKKFVAKAKKKLAARKVRVKVKAKAKPKKAAAKKAAAPKKKARPAKKKKRG